MKISENHIEIIDGYAWQATGVINATDKDFHEAVSSARVSGCSKTTIKVKRVGGPVESKITVTRMSENEDEVKA